jgi:hypothetical protein
MRMVQFFELPLQHWDILRATGFAQGPVSATFATIVWLREALETLAVAVVREGGHCVSVVDRPNTPGPVLDRPQTPWP